MNTANRSVDDEFLTLLEERHGKVVAGAYKKNIQATPEADVFEVLYRVRCETSKPEPRSSSLVECLQFNS